MTILWCDSPTSILSFEKMYRKASTLCVIFGDFKRKLAEMQKFCKSTSYRCPFQYFEARADVKYYLPSSLERLK